MSNQDETPENRLRKELPEEVPAAPAEEGAGEEKSEPGLTGRQRLVKGLWPPRVTRAQLIVALLLFGLGFGLAVQVASNSDDSNALRGARQEDLVRILDELDDRTQRLEDEKQGLEKQRQELENSSDQAEEARKQTVEALKHSQELLRELTAHQERVKEDERRRIAREIHDELGQTLLALRIDVSMLDTRTGRSHPRLNEKVRGALQQIDATMKTIRTIINNLRPAVLDLGLTAAIEWQVNEFRRRSGIDCDLVMDAEELAVDNERATTLFRILQESLTNVIRHANATHVLVEVYKEGGRLTMKIADNGIGLYSETRKTAHSFGLVGMKERVYALNGTFMIASTPGKGTTLTIYIPLETTSADIPGIT